MRLNTLLLKLAILISGRGSNMQAILNSIKKQSIPINPVIVISNKPTARGLRIAKRYGVKTEIVESKGFQGSRWEYDQKIIDVLSRYRITSEKWSNLSCRIYEDFKSGIY